MATLYAGLDISDKETAVCLINGSGDIVFETTVPTEPAAIVLSLKPFRRLISKIGHESGAKATWLHKELLRRKLPVVCLDARHTHAALAASRNKTDKNDARGIAQVLGRGLYTLAYIRSDASQRTRDLLNHRTALLRKTLDLQLLVSSSLKLAGVTLVRSKGSPVIKPARGRQLDFTLIQAVMSTHRAIEALQREVKCLTVLVEKLAESDPICVRLMTMPGVGPITSLCFRSAVDDPARFPSSRSVAAHFGLTPRTFQSGGSSFTGRISKRGDGVMRSLLYQSAGSLINISKSDCRLRTWALRLREQKGFKVAAVGCARRMAVILHQMWITERDFDPRS